MSDVRNVKIGHTSITWKDTDIEDSVKILSELGYAGIETFGWVLDTLDNEGKSDMFAKYGIPLVSSYFSLNIHDPEKWDECLSKLSRWSDLLVKHGTKIVVLGGDTLNRREYDFAGSRDRIVNSINEIGKRLSDKGIIACYHPHTGTPVQTETEIRAVMEAVDGKYVAFAPDIGQIQKGGTDPLVIVKDYYSLLKHVHFKDYIGGEVEFNEKGWEIDKSGYLGYTPLGEGVVDLKGVLDYLEEKKFDGYCMVELDGRHYGPARETYTLENVKECAEKNKAYLAALGYSFGK